MKLLIYFQLLLLPFVLQAQEVKYAVSPDNHYSRISNYADGMAKAELNADSVGYLNLSGKLVLQLPYDYDDAGNFHDGVAAIGKPVYEMRGEKSGFYKVKKYNKSQPLQSVLEAKPVIGLRQFQSVKAVYVSYSGQPVLFIQLNAEGTKKLAKITHNNIGKALALMLDGKTIAVPVISGDILEGRLMIANWERSTIIQKMVDQLNQKRQMKYGYINKKGKVIIPFNYDEVEDFSDNLAAVNKKGVWCIIDKQGKAVIGDSVLITEMHNMQGGYDVEPPPFQDGLMPVQRNGQYGYIDTTGKLVIPYQYDLAVGFDQGVALVAKKIKYEEKDTSSISGKLYHKLPEGTPDYRWSFINTKGDILYRFKGGKEPNMAAGLSEGTVIFKTIKQEQDIPIPRYGIMDKTGRTVIPADYDETLFSLSDDVAVAQSKTPGPDGYTDTLLIIQKSKGIVGKMALNTPYGAVYNYTAYFHEGLMPVEVKNKDGDRLWGYINKKGKWVLSPQFTTALDFHERRAVVVTKDGKVAVIENPMEKVRKND